MTVTDEVTMHVVGKITHGYTGRQTSMLDAKRSYQILSDLSWKQRPPLKPMNITFSEAVALTDYSFELFNHLQSC